MTSEAAAKTEYHWIKPDRQQIKVTVMNTPLYSGLPTAGDARSAIPFAAEPLLRSRNVEDAEALLNNHRRNGGFASAGEARWISTSPCRPCRK